MFKINPARLAVPNKKHITGKLVINTETEAERIFKTYLNALFLTFIKAEIWGFTVTRPRTAVKVSSAPASLTAYGFRQIKNAARPREFSESFLVLN